MLLSGSGSRSLSVGEWGCLLRSGGKGLICVSITSTIMCCIVDIVYFGIYVISVYGTWLLVLYSIV